MQAKFINPSHYADVVQERAIVKQCGYPVCSNPLTGVLKQKYHISMKTNKVYDITDRKVRNFDRDEESKGWVT